MGDVIDSARRQHHPPVEQQWRTDLGWGEMHSRRWMSPSADVTADPYVLVHGLGVASRMCRPLGHRLAAHAAVHAPDLPGFGESHPHPDGDLDIAGLAENLVTWMDVADVGPAVGVGTSVGAQVVAEAASRHPSRFSRVVLASPTVDAERRTWPSQIARWQLEQQTQSMRMRSLIAADYVHCGVPRVAHTFARALEHRPEDAIAEIDAPVLVCWGSKDPLIRREWAEHLAERAPDGRLAPMPGVVHAMCHDSPIELARVASHFVGVTDRPPVRPRSVAPPSDIDLDRPLAEV